MSVSKLCENGDYDVLCRRDKAFILNKDHFVVAEFTKKNGLYMADLKIKNPSYSGFTRPVK